MTRTTKPFSERDIETVLTICRTAEFMNSIENGLDKLFDLGEGGLRSYKVTSGARYVSGAVVFHFRVAVRADTCDLIGGKTYKCTFGLGDYAKCLDPAEHAKMINDLAFDLTMKIAMKCLASVSEARKESDFSTTGNRESWLNNDSNSDTTLRHVLKASIESEIPIVHRDLTESHRGPLFGRFATDDDTGFLTRVRNEIKTRYETLMVPAIEAARECELLAARQAQAEVDAAYNDVETLI